MASVFDAGSKPDAPPQVDLKDLHAKIGELTLEKDFLSGALDKAGLLPIAGRRCLHRREGAQKDD